MATSYRIGKISISKGNTKLDKTVGIFSIPAIKTCPNCKDCAKACYARKAERIYPQVLPCRESNWAASKLPCFVNRMVSIIRLAKVTKFRIHESGDFYSQEYADKWAEIARRLPEVKFWTYTKSPFRPTNCPTNLNIVESILPCGSVNFGPKDEIIAKCRAIPGAVMCPVTMGDKSAICGKTCGLCMTHKHVLFVKH
jgi:hypothetical protein